MERNCKKTCTGTDFCGGGAGGGGGGEGSCKLI